MQVLGYCRWIRVGSCSLLLACGLLVLITLLIHYSHLFTRSMHKYELNQAAMLWEGQHILEYFLTEGQHSDTALDIARA